MTYPAQPGPYGYYGYPPPPPPPPKQRAGLWVGLSFALAVLVALAVTGFVAPGFFLGKNKADPAIGPERVAQGIAAGLAKQDKVALNLLKCGDALGNVDRALATIADVVSASVTGKVKRINETRYTSSMTVDGGSGASPYLNTIVAEAGTWCWKDIEAGNSDNSGDSGGTTAAPPTTKSA